MKVTLEGQPQSFSETKWCIRSKGTSQFRFFSASLKGQSGVAGFSLRFCCNVLTKAARGLGDMCLLLVSVPCTKKPQHLLLMSLFEESLSGLSGCLVLSCNSTLCLFNCVCVCLFVCLGALATHVDVRGEL